MTWTASAQTNRYAGPIWSLLDAGPVLAAAKDITPSKYPDCDDATVDKKMMRVYRADGTGETQDETYTKVLTEKGRRGNRTLSLSFMLPYSPCRSSTGVDQAGWQSRAGGRGGQFQGVDR